MSQESSGSTDTAIYRRVLPAFGALSAARLLGVYNPAFETANG